MSDIGPCLPPHLRKPSIDDRSDSIGPQVPSDCIGPQIPSDDIGPQIPSDDIGPQIPSSHKAESKVSKEEVDESSYGPALPPGFAAKKPLKKVIGPALPSHLQTEDDSSEDEDSYAIGPILPSNTNLDSTERIKEEFEERAKTMKDKLEGKNDPNQKLERETWMTELPEALSKSFGVGPRTFRSKAVDVGDQSIWTDTPADRERKRQEARDKKTGEKRKKDVVRQPTAEEKEMAERVATYNEKTRPKSLLEIHQDKKPKTDDSNVRRPFDRDRDLSMHRTNSKDKVKFITEAKGFNGKFSKGSYESKFL